MKTLTDFEIKQLKKGSIGCCLQKLRWKNGLTQDEFAQLIGCSQSAVSMWENGNYRPYGQTLEKIAELYNLPYDFFDKKSIISFSER